MNRFYWLSQFKTESQITTHFQGRLSGLIIFSSRALLGQGNPAARLSSKARSLPLSADVPDRGHPDREL